MDVPIQRIESNKGKPVIVVDGHKFRQAFLKKSGEISWRCTVQDCAGKTTTDVSCQAVLNGSLAHIHEINPRKLERQILRTAYKRKATDQISKRPSKIISPGMLSTIRKYYKINLMSKIFFATLHFSWF
jgi:hypothetical protein